VLLKLIRTGGGGSDATTGWRVFESEVAAVQWHILGVLAAQETRPATSEPPDLFPEPAVVAAKAAPLFPSLLRKDSGRVAHLMPPTIPASGRPSGQQKLA